MVLTLLACKMRRTRANVLGEADGAVTADKVWLQPMANQTSVNRSRLEEEEEVRSEK